MEEAKKLIAVAKELLKADEKKKPRKNTQQTNAEFLAWIKQNLENQAVKTMRELWEKKYSE